MILKNYLFSLISGNYQQYFADHSEGFLKRFCEDCITSDQIAIHRDGNLVYYAYIRQKTESEIYGICIVCGEICLNLHWLYEYMQKKFDTAACKGVLFCYDTQGKILKNVDDFSSESAEIDSMFRDMKTYLDGQQIYWTGLPQENFTIPLTAEIRLSFKEDGEKKIIDALQNYHNVIVTMENSMPSSYARTVERLNLEKQHLQATNEVLEKELNSLSKQKKQYRLVIILVVAVMLCLAGVIFMTNVLSGNKVHIKALESSLDDRNSTIISLKDSLSQERLGIKQLQNEILGLKNKLSLCKDTLYRLAPVKNTIPMFITDILIANVEYNGKIETDYGERIYSSNTMYLRPKIFYSGIKPGTCDLKIRWYKPEGTMSRGTSSPDAYSQQESLFVYSGSNTKILIGWGNERKGYWGKGTYRIEIWYEDICLKAKTFEIY